MFRLFLFPFQYDQLGWPLELIEMCFFFFSPLLRGNSLSNQLLSKLIQMRMVVVLEPQTKMFLCTM